MNSLAGKKVLVVDDSQFLVKQLKTFLETEMKLSVVGTGGDGMEAVELYGKLRPDLITLDITMPRKDGLTAMREILSLYPDARIFIVSALRGQEIVDCINSGARGYMEKPLQFQDAGYVQDFKDSLLEAFGAG